MKQKFGAGALLLCGIIFMSGCSSDGPDAGVDVVGEEVDSGGKITSYTYENSPVKAIVDGREAELSPFPFSSSAEFLDLPMAKVGTACQYEVEGSVGSIAIAERGGCDFEEKLANVQGWAAGLIVVDSGAADGVEWSLRSPRLDLTDIPVLWSTDVSSVDLLTSGSSITISFSAEVVEEVE